MFFHVILTNNCNLQCKYCFGESLDDFEEDFGDDLEVNYNLPREVGYNVETLNRFCQKVKECTLTFYGGEPLLCNEQLKQIMDGTAPKQFMIQTNGLLLDKLETEYVNRLHTILVSIDGEESLTDYYRGSGTFRKVINNIKLIKQNGYTGELIARMTIMEQTDIEKQVKWLLNNPEFSFTSVHWQLNAGFWGNDFQRRNFQQWTQTSYNPGIRALTEFWVDQMEQTGVVLKLYPLLGIAYSFLHDEKNCLMRCGAGWINYTIQTDGHIIACPTMWGMEKYYVGHIADSDPNCLKQILVADKPCVDCKILGVCGGRCLYTNIVKRWRDEEYAVVCQTVQNLADSIKAQIPRIQRLIENKKISLSQFDYVKYNGAEIIP
jgi:putative peptide-modifying radical SAM enzyme